jgi:hypothetical protein
VRLKLKEIEALQVEYAGSESLLNNIKTLTYNGIC